MAKVTTTTSTSTPRKMRPALSVEAREGQLAAMAFDLAEQQLRDGTASSQVITHFLKCHSSQAKLERERLIEENKLLRAKAQQIETHERNVALAEEAIKAFRRYSGQGGTEEDDEDLF